MARPEGLVWAGASAGTAIDHDQPDRGRSLHPLLTSSPCKQNWIRFYERRSREQLDALAAAGRSVESLAREYEPCAATIHEWVKQAGTDDSERYERQTQ